MSFSFVFILIVNTYVGFTVDLRSSIFILVFSIRFSKNGFRTKVDCPWKFPKIPRLCQLFPQRNIIFHYCQYLRILNFSTQVVLCFLSSLANALTFVFARPLFPLRINFAFHDFLLQKGKYTQI